MTAAAAATLAFVGCGDGSSAPDGGDASTDGPLGDGGCLAPEQRCGSRCVNTQTDPANCGECGNACAGGAFCEMGECTRTCGAGLEACGGSCVDLASDPDHCGECDNVCPDDRTCMGGSCVCAEELIQCGGSCVDPDTDINHCGMCDRACADDESCRSGSCAKLRESQCLDEMDNDEDGLTDCEDVEDCEGATRECDCPDTSDMGTEICGSDGTFGDCMGCEPPPDCSPSAPCMYGWECVAGTCAFDPDATWDILVIDADINTRTVDGDNWDSWPADPKPDPFAEVRVGSESGPQGATSQIDNQFSPEWNERVLINMDGGDIKDYIRFDMLDSDAIGNQFIGACSIRGIEDAVFTGVVRTVDCPRELGTDNSGFRLRFQLEPAE